MHALSFFKKRKVKTQPPGSETSIRGLSIDSELANSSSSACLTDTPGSSVHTGSASFSSGSHNSSRYSGSTPRERSSCGDKASSSDMTQSTASLTREANSVMQPSGTAAAAAYSSYPAASIQNLLNSGNGGGESNTTMTEDSTVFAGGKEGTNKGRNSDASTGSEARYSGGASTVERTIDIPGLSGRPTQPQPLRQTKGRYTLSDFEIHRTLGTGSFGRVHLVRSVHNQRYYAIKVLKKQQVVKMKQVEHTNDERRMLQRVKHPFLISLWGTFQDAKNLYMVMDFVEGGELFSLLRKSHRFPNPVAKFYAAEVTLALDYLHSMNIIYRDLKPENLLLDRHGHIKITDFGFAKVVPDITWTLCGTPDYLAPEVVGSKGYNKSVDWWSLGILIFEMLCGFTPFWDGESPMKIYENIMIGKVKYPAFIYPDALDLLQKLITPDLTKRLGNLHGGSRDVMLHPWFSEVTWERLLTREIDAPYVPPVKAGVGDCSQFDKYAEESEPYGQSGDDPHSKYFKDF